MHCSIASTGSFCLSYNCLAVFAGFHVYWVTCRPVYVPIEAATSARGYSNSSSTEGGDARGHLATAVVGSCLAATGHFGLHRLQQMIAESPPHSPREFTKAQSCHHVLQSTQVTTNSFASLLVKCRLAARAMFVRKQTRTSSWHFCGVTSVSDRSVRLEFKVCLCSLVGIEYLVERWEAEVDGDGSGWDFVTKWEDVLSLGEQRAFDRCRTSICLFVVKTERKCRCSL
eukprot:SAG31_NODE_1126_length_9767_cov_5.580058_4_plen_228_part_00